MRRVRNDQAGKEQTDGGQHSSPVIDLAVAGAGLKKPVGHSSVRHGASVGLAQQILRELAVHES